MSRRRNIRKSIKLKILKTKLNTLEKIIVNILVIIIFIVIYSFYSNFSSFDLPFYGIGDVQSFNIDKSSLKEIYEVSNKKEIELEKLLVSYAKENNYFSENTFINRFKGLEKNRLLENLKFMYFSLDGENKQIYKMLKNINEDLKTLPFKNENLKNLKAINSFSLDKENLSIVFFEKKVTTEGVEVVSCTDGVVESVGYNGDKGLQVVVLTSNRNKFIYTSLSNVVPEVKKGVYIKNGDTIGFMGNTKQVSDKVVFERVKLNLYIVLNKEYFGEELFINPYPFMYLKALEN